MNLKHLNLDRYGIPDEPEIQMEIFLIAAELRIRKLNNGLASIGCDGSYCIPDLCDIVLALADFEELPDRLYDFYFSLLDEYCEKVTHENKLPIKEAISIYNKLIGEKWKEVDWQVVDDL
jgi:hypothetical protein